MGTRRRSANRQGDLFPRSKRPVILIEENHRLVRMTDEIDWTALVDLVETIRRSKVTSAAGRPPHLRALTGALVFRATRKMTYRDTEDQIRHYAPARYLCGLTESEWTPDANTIQDFEQLLGEDGLRRLNEYVVTWAVEEQLADPAVVVADTTAQEAAIPHPNEMGLMATFVSMVVAASKQVGSALKGFIEGAGHLFATAKRKVREYRLFAKKKTKAQKDRMVAQMATVVSAVQQHLRPALLQAGRTATRLRRHRKHAWKKLQDLQRTMTTLLPQIRHWVRTGFVAPNKIISLQVPELYAIVRNKVGKAVEFGLSWGLTRLRGGFLLATRARHKSDLHDRKFAVRAVKDHVALFGKVPRAYAYDRGGWSRANVEQLRQMGVRDIGVAPQGKAAWAVHGTTKRRLVAERTLIEGGIGTIKREKYGFNRPAARSVDAMAMCGQRSVLGFNLNKLVHGLAARNEMVLVG